LEIGRGEFMSNVITQVEMMKYTGMEEVVFDAGTILTPSAKDWAKDHGLKVVIGEYSTERKLLLDTVIKAVINNSGKAGGFLKKEEIIDIVAQCLAKLGCKVD